MSLSNWDMSLIASFIDHGCSLPASWMSVAACSTGIVTCFSRDQQHHVTLNRLVPWTSWYGAFPPVQHCLEGTSEIRSESFHIDMMSKKF